MQRPGRPSVQEFPVADGGAGPYGITAGADGALWITLVHSGEIARRTPGGELTTYPLGSPAGGPMVITAGPDGALWFTLNRADAIGRITVDGEVGAFPLGSGCGPYGITTGPDGALWFTEMHTDRIGRITVDGEVTRFPLPVEKAFPSAITAGPDGALWFTLNQADATAGSASTARSSSTGSPRPGPLRWASPPVPTPCGSPRSAGRIGRISTDGEVREFPLPDPAARPHAVAVTPAGDCWFTAWGTGRIGRVTAAGETAEYDLPTPSSEPHGIAVGPDGALWTALETGGVARVVP